MKTLTPDDSSMMKLVSRIKSMYFLDGGHAGGRSFATFYKAFNIYFKRFKKLHKKLLEASLKKLFEASFKSF